MSAPQTTVQIKRGDELICPGLTGYGAGSVSDLRARHAREEVSCGFPTCGRWIRKGELHGSLFYTHVCLSHCERRR